MKKSFRSAWQFLTMSMMLAVCLGFSTSAVLADQTRLVGSGASFPFPLYSTGSRPSAGPTLTSW